MMNARTLRFGALLALSLCAPAMAAYPEKPVRIVVGFAAGGPTDVVARLFAEKLTQLNGQPFIVDNKPGAAAMIAATEVARAPADGYTLLMTATNHATSPAVLPKVPYDTQKDFAAIMLVAEGPHVLVVGAQSPFSSVKDVVAAAKAKPSDLTYSSSGKGGTVHFAGAMFEEAAGVDLIHVPYKGAAPAVQDLMAGQVQLSFASLASVSAQVRAGKSEAPGHCRANARRGLPVGADVRRSRLPHRVDIRLDGTACTRQDAARRAREARDPAAADRRNARCAAAIASAWHDARRRPACGFRRANRE